MKLKLKWRRCLYCLDINTDHCIIWGQLASEYILNIWFTKGLQNLNSKRKQRTKSKNKNKNIFFQIKTEDDWL